MRSPPSLRNTTSRTKALSWWVHAALFAIISTDCRSHADTQDSDSFDVSDVPAVSETDSDDSHDIDTSSNSECSNTDFEAPTIGCPCTNQPGALPYCCTRASMGDQGWYCGGLIWYYYGHGGRCDGNPATCPECPLCPEAWEPDQ